MNKGETHTNAKLTEMDVINLRELGRYAAYLRSELKKVTQKERAKKFEVSPNAVWKIDNYVTWKDL